MPFFWAGENTTGALYTKLWDTDTIRGKTKNHFNGHNWPITVSRGCKTRPDRPRRNMLSRENM